MEVYSNCQWGTEQGRGGLELPTGVADDNVKLGGLFAAKCISMSVVGHKSDVHHSSK